MLGVRISMRDLARFLCRASPISGRVLHKVHFGWQDLLDNDAPRTEWPGRDPTGEPLPATEPGVVSGSAAGPCPSRRARVPRTSPDRACGPCPTSRTVGQDKALALIRNVSPRFPLHYA